MSFLDFFKKKADDGTENINAPTDNPSEKVAPNSHLNSLMHKMYQQSQQRAASSSAGKPKRVSSDAEYDGKGLRNIKAMFDIEGHRIPDINHNKAYGFEDEDFALSIPRPEPDLEKARKLFDMGMKEGKTEEDGWAQKCHFLLCSYMFGYEPALKEYQKQREKCRARYRQLCGKTDDYLRLTELRHPARRFALCSAFNSGHFAKVWSILMDSSYGRTLESAWNDLVTAMKLYKIPGPKHDIVFYSSFLITIEDDIERIWAGIRKELWEYVDRLCPIDSDAIDKTADDYEHDAMVYSVLGAFTGALYALNAMYDKVFEAVWETPLNLYYNFGEL